MRGQNIYIRGLILLVLLTSNSLFSFSQEKERFLNFNYITISDNNENNLYSINTDYTLVYFYSPECEECTKLKKKLSKNKYLNKLIHKRHVTLLAILPDAQKDYWLENSEFIPNNWINSWNKDDEIIIRTYLKTLPTLFLLDKDKYIIGYFRDTKLLFDWIKTKAYEYENNNN